MPRFDPVPPIAASTNVNCVDGYFSVRYFAISPRNPVTFGSVAFALHVSDPPKNATVILSPAFARASKSTNEASVPQSNPAATNPTIKQTNFITSSPKCQSPISAQTTDAPGTEEISR